MHLTWCWPVTLFTLAYLALATPFALRQQNTEFLFYIAVVVVLGLVTLAIHRRVGLSQGLLWGLSLWGLLHMLGGLLSVPVDWTDNGSGVLYSVWLIPQRLRYDQVIHAYGFGLATWLCWQCVRTIPGARPSFGVLSLCALAGMGLGAANEIVEFAATLMIPGTNVGGYVNTGWDLVANMLGSIVAAVLIKLTQRN